MLINHRILITVLSTITIISSILSIIASIIYFFQVSYLLNEKSENFNNKETFYKKINDDFNHNLNSTDKSKETNCIKDIGCQLHEQPANRGLSNSHIKTGNRGDCSLINKCFDRRVNSYSDYCTDDTIKSSILFYENSL